MPDVVDIIWNNNQGSDSHQWGKLSQAWLFLFPTLPILPEEENSWGGISPSSPLPYHSLDHSFINCRKKRTHVSIPLENQTQDMSKSLL